MDIDIQPPTDVYETFGRLNYKPWHAIAEFVDNSTQNFFAFSESLRASIGDEPTLTIQIDYDHNAQSLQITDDAHGMGPEEFSRALRLSAPPPDPTGRCEFGMGLKTASCWFGKRWELTSTRLGEEIEYHAVMDLEELSRTNVASIKVEERKVSPLTHGTTLTIDPLRRRVYGRAIERIKDTLSSMYRLDLDTGKVKIFWGDEPLQYEPPVLHEETLPDGEVRLFRQPINATVTDPTSGEDHIVTGWLGILAKMSSRDNGIALIRRGRVIIGGPRDNWCPTQVLGSAGGMSWKRLVGELHVDSFPVNFSKDGFAWDTGLEQALIDVLKKQTVDYRAKATDMRTRGTKIKPADFERATESINEHLDREALRRELSRLEAPARPLIDPVEDAEERTRLIEGSEGPTELKVAVPQGELVARLYLREDDPRLEWLSLSFAQPDEVDVFLNIRHPFVAAFTDDDRSIAMLQMIALALALAEKRARMLEGAKIYPDDLRTHLDTFLKHFVP